MTAAPTTRGLLAPTSAPTVPTVGVEEEFMLVWPDGNVASIAPEVLGWLPGGVRAQASFAPYRVESATGDSTELADVGHTLSVARRVLAESAADLGARLLAVGTPPFGAPGVGVTSACHVTVGLPDADLRPAALRRLQPWFPALLALTGNSPLWRGRDTGWSSHRFAVRRRRPPGVPVPRRATAVENIEIRLADSALSVPDALLIAGLCRALVGSVIDDELAGRPCPEVPDHVLVAVARAAARQGMVALVVSPGHARLAPAGEVLDELVTAVAPVLEDSGDALLVSELLADRLRRGSGAERQRALWRLGRPEAFVQALANLCAGVDPHR
jgi:glutamate---cysteine ligase / carboxylate-amine ligase